VAGAARKEELRGKSMEKEIARLTEELKRADKHYLDLKNNFDQCIAEAREEGKREGYDEATKRAIEMAVFNIPYISPFENTPGRLVGIVIPD
jgi:predicted nuclease with TOPRIM domain